jgi:regulator of sigma E protease
MLTIFLFLIILSILVVAHEWGHFAAARKSGMRVYEFGIGFPPRAIGWYRDPATRKFVRVKKGDDPEQLPATVYSLNWLPLGGFCKIKGENGDEAAAPDSFGFQAAWKRVAVLIAGVAMNVLLAGVLLGIGFAIGIPADVSAGVPNGAILMESPSVAVQDVAARSAAAEAGIRAGDTILALDGASVASADAFVREVVAKNGAPAALSIRRGGETLSITATPRPLKDGDGTPKLGLMLADAAMIRYPWYAAIPHGFVAAITGWWAIFVAAFGLFKELLLGRGLADGVSGPVGIASMIGTSARLGFRYLLNTTAMISLVLAAMNILPIPALDGGRAVFVLIEKIFRRRVSMKYEQAAHTIGFLLLLALILYVTGRDIVRLIQ